MYTHSLQGVEEAAPLAHTGHGCRHGHTLALGWEAIDRYFGVSTSPGNQEVRVDMH